MVTETVTIIVRERGANVTSRSIRRVGVSSAGAAQGVRLLTTALIGLTAAFGIRELVQFADSAILIQNRVDVATDSVEAYNAVLFRLREISNGTRTSLQGNAELFQRLNVATRDLGTSQNDVLDVVEGLNAAIAVSGTEAVSAAAGINQLAQALASGRLQGDELRSISENLPQLFQRLGDELGVTTGELRELGASGELTTDVLFPALQRAVADFRGELDGLQFTTAQTFNVLRNELVIAVGAVNQVLQASGFLNDGILVLADNVGNVLVQAFAFFVELTGEALNAGAGLLELLGELGVILPSLGNILSVVANGFLLFFRSIDTGFQAIRTGVAAVRAGILSVGEALGIVEQTDVAGAFEDFAAAQNDLIASSQNTNEVLQELGGQFLEIAATGSPADAAADRLRELAGAADGLSDSLTALVADGRISIPEFTGEPGPIDTGVLDQQRDAVARNAEDDGNAFGKIFGEAASSAFSGVFSGEGINVFETLANVGADLVGKALTDVFTDLGNSLGDLITSGLEGLGLGGLGGALGGLAGVGLGLLSNALEGTSTNVRSGIAQSAVTSSQEVRGVVAGPTNIPVFEVGNAIEAAFQETNNILRAILVAVENQPAAVATVATPGGSSAQALSTTTPSLI